MSRAEFDKKNKCPKCGGANKVTATDTMGHAMIMEAITKCTVCGHEDYWAYGLYESKASGN